jgi:NTE family protein
MPTRKISRQESESGDSDTPPCRRVAIACQGGGSHTAFSAGVLQGLLKNLPPEVQIVALSGTSGGAICAALAWDGLVRGAPDRAVRQLRSFWDATAANEPWDALIDMALMHALAIREIWAVPEVSPYQLPNWGEEQFRALIDRYFDFAELRELARQPEAPGLQIGAVEVLSGNFELFTGEELCTDCLLASAAIPELFRAVHVPGRGVYWDGLFSQNPPIHDLMKFQIDELWVIQINPNACSQIPQHINQIKDRRNELAGNISMEQEIHFIETINRALAEGFICNPKYRPIVVSRIRLDRELGYASKMSRSPNLLADLQQYGETKARLFYKERSRKHYALQALSVDA